MKKSSIAITMMFVVHNASFVAQDRYALYSQMRKNAEKRQRMFSEEVDRRVRQQNIEKKVREELEPKLTENLTKTGKWLYYFKIPTATTQEIKSKIKSTQEQELKKARKRAVKELTQKQRDERSARAWALGTRIRRGWDNVVSYFKPYWQSQKEGKLKEGRMLGIQKRADELYQERIKKHSWWNTPNDTEKQRLQAEALQEAEESYAIPGMVFEAPVEEKEYAPGIPWSEIFYTGH